MPTTVEIQSKFFYGFTPIIIMLLVVFSPFIVWAIKKRLNKKNEPQIEEVKEEIPQIKEVPLPVKESYYIKLQTLKQQYISGQIMSKEGHQRLSKMIRQFVCEYASVDLTKKTLEEIRNIEVPYIEALIEEYYTVEFSPDQMGDFEDALNKTQKVIELWS